MNLSVKRKLMLLGCLLWGVQAVSQTCPIPPANVTYAQGTVTITPNGVAGYDAVGWVNGTTPAYVFCQNNLPLRLLFSPAKNTTFTTGDRAYYYYQYTGTTIPTTGGTQYPTSNTSPVLPAPTSNKFVVIQTVRSNAGVTKSYACKVVEMYVPKQPVAEITSCTNREITVDISNADNNKTFDSFEIRWGDGNTEPFSNNKTNPAVTKKHPYPNNGNYNIVVRGIVNGQTCELPLTRNNVSANGTGANPISLPSFVTGNIAVLSNSQIQLVFNNSPVPNQNRTMEFLQSTDGGASFTNLGGENLGAGSQTKTFNVTNANTQQYCYKIRQRNTCGAVSNDSEMNCSIPIEAVVANKEITINWKLIPGGRFTTQQVRGTNGGVSSAALNATTNTYTDKNKTCQPYSYAVVAFKTTAPAMTSTSITLNPMGKDDTKPETITNAFLTVNNNRVEIRATFPRQPREVTFHRASGTPLPPILTPSTSQNLPDPQSEPDKQQQCYKISYKNTCEVESDKSDDFCAVFLKPTADGLEWTDYKKFATGIDRYEIEKKSGASWSLQKRLTATDLTYKPDPSEVDATNGEARYRIKAIAKTTGQISYSNETVFAPKAKLFISEAFTPNGDGSNDIFEIKGYFVKEFSMKIYNRWGRVVWEKKTDDAAEFGRGIRWDGKIGTDELAPMGTYLYEYEVADYKGQTEKKKGYFFLIQ